MSSLKNVLYDKTNLILFNLMSVILLSFVLNNLLISNIYLYINYGLKTINMLWGSIILFKDIIGKKIDIKDNKIKALLIFNIIAIVSWFVFFIRNRCFSHLYDVILLWEYSFIFYTFYKGHSKNDIDNILKCVAYVFCICVFIYNVISLFLYFFGFQKITFPNESYHVMYENPNSAAHSSRYMGIWPWFTTGASRCVLGIIFHLYLVDVGENKWTNIMGILLSGVMIFLTDSRGQELLLGFIIIVDILFYLRKKIEQKRMFKVTICSLLLFAIGVVGYIFIKNPNLLQALISSPFKVINEISSDRLAIAEYILKNNDKWILGWGYANNELLIESSLPNYPHNIFLALLLYTGVTGLISFAIFIGIYIFDLKKIFKRVLNSNLRWIFIFVICQFFESLIDNSIIGAYSTHIQTMCFWFCLGSILIVRKEG